MRGWPRRNGFDMFGAVEDRGSGRRELVMIGFELQRKNMVESQVRPSDVTDRRIIAAMLEIPREAFAAADTRAMAYMDQDLPVGPAVPSRNRRALVTARTLARMVQQLEIEAGDRVLEIGTATGYGAAVLARIAKVVVALESDEVLAVQAQAVLKENAVDNASIARGPLAAGWPAEAPYAAILIAGTVQEIPAAVLDQLQDGGRLVGIRHENGLGRLMQWRRIGTSFAARVVGEAGARPLPGFERSPGFVF